MLYGSSKLSLASYGSCSDVYTLAAIYTIYNELSIGLAISVLKEYSKY
jgi:hypothetical protein